MGRAGRVICERAAPGRSRRLRSKASDDDDEDDEEYVLENDEEEESCEEPLASDGDEEDEFEFGESTSGGSSDDEPVIHFDEDDEYEDALLTTRSKRRKAPSKTKRLVNKSRVSYDEDDVDYEENDEDEKIFASRSKRLKVPSKPNSKVKKLKASYDDDDDDYAGEEAVEEDLPVRKTGKNKNSAGIRYRQQQSRASDYVEETAEEDDKDEDFSPAEQDFDDDEPFLIFGLERDGALEEDGSKRKSRVLRQNKRKVSWRKKPKVVHEDDSIVKDRVDVEKKTKKTAKTRRKKSSKSRAVKKKLPVESETSDFDSVTSDNDFVDNTITVDRRRNKFKNVRKTKKAGTRRNSVLDELGSSSDSEYIVSEEELRDLGVVGIMDRPKRIVAGRKRDQTGKEKESEELGKPLCGICLSEEQSKTVRGVLNCCTHFFCSACILEWSKVESRCPVCKRRFETIAKSSSSDSGFRLTKTVIKVEERNQVYQPSEEEIRRMLDPYENVVCIECHQGGDDRLMLLCDICDSPSHTYCVGLGREVPEGNWYCQTCRSVGQDISYLQDQVFGTDQVGNSDFLSRNGETEISAARVNANLQRSSQPSMLEFDLNVSPRPVEDYGSMSQPIGAGPQTVSGRRAMRQRIRIMLSNSRPRQIFEENHVSRSSTISDAMTSGQRQSGESLHASHALSSNAMVPSEEIHQSNRPSVQFNSNLSQCTTQGSSLQHLDGAK